jgi:hypothetical protein
MMTRVLVTMTMLGAVGLTGACDSPPTAPSPPAAAAQAQPASGLADRTFEIVLSNDDSALELGKQSYEPDAYSSCGPCQVIELGPRLPKTVVLAWTAGVTMHAYPRLKIGVPLTEPRVHLDAPVRITVTMSY